MKLGFVVCAALSLVATSASAEIVTRTYTGTALSNNQQSGYVATYLIDTSAPVVSGTGSWTTEGLNEPISATFTLGGRRSLHRRI
jgi:hypothetical protein